MTNEIKEEAAKKRGPKPKVKKYIPMNVSAQQLSSLDGLDPNFYHRWCAGYGKGKIERYIAAGYEHVMDKETGQKRMRPGGDPLFLMRQPMELREKELLAKRGGIIETNRILNQKNQPNKNSSVPEYIPGDANQVVERDNLS